jgi:methanethiol S-methyltransferase
LFYPILIVVCVTAWGFLHSWLASLRTKRIARQLLGEWVNRFYRILFIGIAILTLSPILAMVVFLPSRLLWRIHAPWVYGTATIQAAAVVGLIVTILMTDVWSFVGLRQLKHPNGEEKKSLVVKGLYGFVRHPLYLLVILFMWLIPYMTGLILAFVIASTGYFILGSIPEERKMLEIYGDAYRRYQESVPRIIPWIKLR